MLAQRPSFLFALSQLGCDGSGMASRWGVIELAHRQRESPASSDLLAVMAHSLLTSIATIKTASSMLTDRELDEHQTDRVIGIISRQADHLHEVIGDLARTGEPARMATLDGLDRRAPSARCVAGE